MNGYDVVFIHFALHDVPAQERPEVIRTLLADHPLIVDKAEAAFDAFHETVGEAGGGRPVHDLVIEADSQTEELAVFERSLDQYRLLGDATDDNVDRQKGDRHPPTGPLTEHTNGGEPDGPGESLDGVRISHQDAPDRHPYEGGQPAKEGRPAEPLHPAGLLDLARLGGPDLVVNLAEGLLIRRPDDVGRAHTPPIHLALDHGIDVDVVETDDLPLAAPVGVDRSILRYRCRQAIDEEGCGGGSGERRG